MFKLREMGRVIAKDSDFKSSPGHTMKRDHRWGKAGTSVGRPFRCYCGTPLELGPLGWGEAAEFKT